MSRLDPFALPTETTGRYRMLVLAAFVVVWSLAPGFAPDLVVESHDLLPRARIGELGTGGSLADQLGRALDADRSVSVVLRIGARFALSILLVALAATAAWWLYRSHPQWRGLDSRVRPLAEADAPGLVAELQGMISAAGLAGRPRLAQVPGALGGLAYGRKGRETLVLCCAPDLLESAWPSDLRPVALHELAHIANRDVTYQELSRGAWLAAATLIAIHGGWIAVRAAVDEGVGSTTATAPETVVGHLVLLATAAMLWVGLVRKRELYADWRVVTWGYGELLRHRLVHRGDSHQPGEAGRGDAAARRIRRWLRSIALARRLEARFHPSRRERVAVLDDPRPLFAMTPGLTLSTALLVTIGFGHSNHVLGDALTAARTAMTGLFVIIGPAAAIPVMAFGLFLMTGIAYLLTSAMGVQIQRDTLADLATADHSQRPDWGYRRLGGTAVLFAAGLEIGLLASPAGLLFAPIPPLHVLGWLLAFTGLTWLWLVCVRAMTRLLLGSHLGDRPPRRLQWSITWTSSLLLAVLYSPALAIRVSLFQVARAEDLVFLGRSELPIADAILVLFVMSNLVLLALALAVTALAGLMGVLGAGWWLGLRRRRCSSCGIPVIPRLAVGRHCEGCDRPLASWLLLKPPDQTAGAVP